MSGPTGLRSLSAGVPVAPGSINPGGQAIRIGEACANSFDPSIAPGLDRPVGSILCRRNGIAAWLKTGPGVLDWQVVGASSGTGGVGGTSTASLERVVETRGQFLTGAAGLTFWHEPFVVGPAGAGSQWRDLHATDFHPADSVPGGVAQVFSNTGYGAIVVDPFAEYPGPAANHGWSIAGVLAAATPLYLFARFRLRSNPGTGGPGGWDGQCSFVIGLVDPTTQGIVGVGLGLGQTFFGAVGGDVVDHGATSTPWLNGINAMIGIPSTVARDFDAWHTAELYTTGGAWKARIDGGAEFDVSSIMPGIAVHGTPIVEVVGFGVTSPALEVDHIAIGTARNGAVLAPLGPDPGGVSNVTARSPLTSTGGATPVIAWPATYDNLPARLDALGAVAALTTPAAVAAYVGSAVALAGAALGNAAATLTVAGGNCYTMPAGTLTAERVLTLGTGGAPLTGEVITVIRLDAAAFTLTLKDDAGTTLVALPASVKAIVSCRWNGAHFSDPSVQRVA